MPGGEALREAAEEEGDDDRGVRTPSETPRHADSRPSPPATREMASQTDNSGEGECMVAAARPRRKSRGLATPCEMEEGSRRTRVPRASLEFGSPGGHGALRSSRLSTKKAEVCASAEPPAPPPVLHPPPPPQRKPPPLPRDQPPEAFSHSFCVSGEVLTSKVCRRFACVSCGKRTLAMGANEKVYGGKGMTLHFTCINSECERPSVHLRLGSMVRLQRQPTRQKEVGKDADEEEPSTDDDSGGEEEEEPKCGSFSKESTLAVLAALMGGQQYRAYAATALMAGMKPLNKLTFQQYVVRGAPRTIHPISCGGEHGAGPLCCRSIW
mgnify:FL=1